MSPHGTAPESVDPIHEDLLRRALSAEAAQVAADPSPANFRHVLERASRRTRARRIGTASMAVAAAVALVVLAVVVVDSGPAEQIDVVTDPEPRVTPTTVPEPTEVTDPQPATIETARGIYPFTTGAEADDWYADWSGGSTEPEPFGEFDPTSAGDVARLFAVDFLGFLPEKLRLSEPRQGDPSSWEVEVTTRDRGPTTTILIRRLGASPALTATGALSENIVIDSPEVLSTVSSPVRIDGQSRAFEGNVVIQIRTDRQLAVDTPLAEKPLIGGSGPDFGPLRGDIVFPAPTEPLGALVALVYSAEDGSVDEASVIRIGFGETASTTPG